MQLVLLGTGTPNADPEHSGPCAAVIVAGCPYLIDAGPGLVRRAAAAAHSGITALSPPKLKRAFVTHLHSDHTVGLPDLILSPWVLGRRDPLELYGPPGTVEMARHILAAYREDIRERIEGLEPANDDGWRVRAHDIQDGEIYRDARVVVAALPVKHGSWPAYAYRFASPERTIVISGDTAPTADLVPFAAGCDVLLHEVYSVAGYATRPARWKAYHAQVHTATHELAALARDIRPKLLVLYHQLRWGVSDAELVAEIASQYPGAIVSGRDLDVY